MASAGMRATPRTAVPDASPRTAAEEWMKKTFLRLGDDGSPISDGRRKRTAGNGAKARRLSPKERQLTTREREILRFLAFGMGTAAIAKELSISPATVRNHAQRILAKLQVHSRLAAVARVAARRAPSQRASVPVDEGIPRGDPNRPGAAVRVKENRRHPRRNRVE